MYINILNSILKYIKFEFLIIMLINAFLVPLHTLKMAINPYGEGGACAKVVKVLKEAPLNGIIKKTFYDL